MAKITVQGTASWAKVFEQNRDLTGYKNQWVDTDGRCTITVLLDDAQTKKVLESGCMSKGKENPDGAGRLFTFNRKFKTDNDFNSGTPDVFKLDGSRWDLATDGMIGNGSEVLVELDIYASPKYDVVSTRLERVKVLEHVSYGEPMGVDQFTKNLGSAVPPPAAPPSNKELTSDEIPF